MTATALTEHDLLGGFTKAALDAAFTKVASPVHWKAPIDITVALTPTELVTTAFAITFFTATGANFLTVSPGVYHVTAPGYWGGPAN